MRIPFAIFAPFKIEFMQKYLILSLLFLEAIIVQSVIAQSKLSPYQKHIDTLASAYYEGRRAGTKGDTLAARYIAQQFANIEKIELLGNYGLQEVSYIEKQSSGATKEVHTFNVVALLKAPVRNNPKQNRIIIGAHYDHEGIKRFRGKKMLHPGADDNASGIAFLIELARELSQNQMDLRQDIIFIAFGAEERGLKGSAYYASHPLLPNEQVKAMVNFDMLGRMQNKGLTIRGLSTAEEAIDIFRALPNPDGLEIVWEMRGNGPTDYSSFYAVGIPAFSFSTRVHKDYHLPGDMPAKINYEGMEMAHRYIMPLINQLAFKKIKLTYTPQN